MISLEGAWGMILRERMGGYCMAPHMEYYRQTHHCEPLLTLWDRTMTSISAESAPLIP